MNCHDNIHFHVHCFGGSFRPSEAVFGRMYKVNRKQAHAADGAGKLELAVPKPTLAVIRNWNMN